jgi:hypothetical protein
MKLKASTYKRLTSHISRLTLLLILVAFSSSYTVLYKEGEIIVKFKNDPSNQTLKSQAISKTFNIHVIKLPSNMKVEEALKKYKNDPNVEYAEPNYIIKKLETTPNILTTLLNGDLLKYWQIKYGIHAKEVIILL